MRYRHGGVIGAESTGHTVPVSLEQFFPAGVTLQAIDGGTNYYSANGFTQAVTNGWDGSSFFPIGVWLAPMLSQADADRWVDLGINVGHGLTASSTLSLLRSNNLSLIFQAEPASEITTILAGNGGSFGTELVGLICFDEPGTTAEAWGAMQTTANSIQDAKFWYETYTHNQYEFGDVGGVPMATLLSSLRSTPNSTTRHLNVVAADVYWLAGTATNFGRDGVYGLAPGTMTNDQCRRACHYGDMIDKNRVWQASNFPAPIIQFVENGGPYTEDTTAGLYITPPEMNAAVWSSIIHGARMVTYFNHTFAGPAQSSDNFAASYYQTIQSGNSISIYNQAKATNALVKSLASVLNSQFALNYVTVSPAGTPITNFAGFDVMAKWTGSRFYIFALPRYSESTTNQTATFTIKNSGATQATVINESRSIALTNGGTQFVDTFADGNTVHIYRID